MAAATPAEPNAEPTVDLAHQPASDSPASGEAEAEEPAAKRSRR